jgi:hypothetical protein
VEIRLIFWPFIPPSDFILFIGKCLQIVFRGCTAVATCTRGDLILLHFAVGGVKYFLFWAAYEAWKAAGWVESAEWYPGP